MLKVIYSRRGTGKTKEMIRLANADVENVNGDIVFWTRITTACWICITT